MSSRGQAGVSRGSWGLLQNYTVCFGVCQMATDCHGLRRTVIVSKHPQPQTPRSCRTLSNLVASSRAHVFMCLASTDFLPTSYRTCRSNGIQQYGGPTVFAARLAGTLPCDSRAPPFSEPPFGLLVHICTTALCRCSRATRLPEPAVAM